MCVKILITILLLSCFSSAYASGNMSWQYIDGKLMYTRVMPKIIKKAPKKEIENIEWKVVESKVVSKEKKLDLNKKSKNKVEIHTPIQPIENLKKVRFSNATNMNEHKLYEEDLYRIPSFEEQKAQRAAILAKMARSNGGAKEINLKNPEDEKAKQKKSEMIFHIANRDEMIKKLRQLHTDINQEKDRILAARVKRKKDIERYEELRVKFIELKKIYDEEYGKQ